MAADADNQPLPQDRLERLAELSDDEFERLIDPPRRGVITRRALIAAMLSAGVGWATIQNVLAQADENDSDGDIGTPSNRVDIFADGIDANSLAMSDIDVNSVTTGSIDSDYAYDAGAYNSLEDAVSAAGSDNVGRVLTPTGDYGGFTVSESVVIKGSSRAGFPDSSITSSMTLSAYGAEIHDFFFSDNDLNIDNTDQQAISLLDATITVSDNNAILSKLKGCDVTFESGTSSGVVDTSVNTTVTDNGSNTIGDIS